MKLRAKKEGGRFFGGGRTFERVRYYFSFYPPAQALHTYNNYDIRNNGILECGGPN